MDDLLPRPRVARLLAFDAGDCTTSLLRPLGKTGRRGDSDPEPFSLFASWTLLGDARAGSGNGAAVRLALIAATATALDGFALSEGWMKMSSSASSASLALELSLSDDELGARAGESMSHDVDCFETVFVLRFPYALNVFVVPSIVK